MTFDQLVAPPKSSFGKLQTLKISANLVGSLFVSRWSVAVTFGVEPNNDLSNSNSKVKLATNATGGLYYRIYDVVLMLSYRLKEVSVVRLTTT